MSIFFLLFGLVFALSGVVLLWDYITVFTTYEILPGKVKAFQKRQKRSKNSSTTIYYPVIEYIAYGNTKEFQANSGSSWPMYDIGEAVEVYYSKKYDDGRLKSITSAVVGSIFCLIGLGICYLFWVNVEMTFFSLIPAVGLSGAVAWFFGMMLRKKEIKSVPELTQKVRNYKKEKKLKNGPGDNLITTQKELMDRDQPANKNIKIIGPVFTCIGFLVICGAVYVGLNRWDFLDRALLTEGEVIRFEQRTDDDGTTYYPVVEFQLPDVNQKITFQHDVGSSTPSYNRGAVVPVLYDPDNIREAIIDEGIWNWFGPIVISVVGCSFFFLGGALTVRWMKVKRFQKKAQAQL